MSHNKNHTLLRHLDLKLVAALVFLLITAFVILFLSAETSLNTFASMNARAVGNQGMETGSSMLSQRRGVNALIDGNPTPAVDSCRMEILFVDTSEDSTSLSGLAGVTFNLVSLVDQANPVLLESISNFESDRFRSQSRYIAGTYGIFVEREGYESQSVEIRHSGPDNCSHVIPMVAESEDPTPSVTQEPSETPVPTTTPRRTPTPRRNPTGTTGRGTPTTAPDGSERACQATIEFVDSVTNRPVNGVSYIFDRVHSEEPLELERILEERNISLASVTTEEEIENGLYRLVVWQEGYRALSTWIYHDSGECSHSVVLTSLDADDSESDNPDTPDDENETTPAPTGTSAPEPTVRATLTPVLANTACEMILSFNGVDGTPENRLRFNLERILEETGDEVVTESVESNRTSLWPVYRIVNMLSGRYRVTGTFAAGEHEGQTFETRFDHQAPANCQHTISPVDDIVVIDIPDTGEDEGGSDGEQDTDRETNGPLTQCRMSIQLLEEDNPITFGWIDLDRIAGADGNQIEPETIVTNEFLWGGRYDSTGDVAPGTYRVTARRFLQGEAQSSNIEVLHGAPDNCDHRVDVETGTEAANEGREPTNTPTRAPQCATGYSFEDEDNCMGECGTRCESSTSNTGKRCFRCPVNSSTEAPTRSPTLSRTPTRTPTLTRTPTSRPNQTTTPARNPSATPTRQSPGPNQPSPSLVPTGATDSRNATCKWIPNCDQNHNFLIGYAEKEIPFVWNNKEYFASMEDCNKNENKLPVLPNCEDCKYINIQQWCSEKVRKIIVNFSVTIPAGTEYDNVPMELSFRTGDLFSNNKDFCKKTIAVDSIRGRVITQQCVLNEKIAPPIDDGSFYATLVYTDKGAKRFLRSKAVSINWKVSPARLNFEQVLSPN